jgi:hypothetical protein
MDWRVMALVMCNARVVGGCFCLCVCGEKGFLYSIDVRDGGGFALLEWCGKKGEGDGRRGGKKK